MNIQGNTDNRYLSYDIYEDTGETLDKGPVHGGVLKLFSTYPDTLNPLKSKNKYVGSFSSLIFESLVKPDRNQKPLPLLSDRWEVSSDGLVWTFHIRDNVKWHDGQPMTALDAEYTFGVLSGSKPDSIYWRNIQNIEAFEATEANEFRVVLKKPNSFTPLMLTFPILPRHYFSKLTDDAENITPVGTGPYKFVAYKENESIELAANRSWWNSKGNEKNEPDMPYIDKVLIKLYEKNDDAVNAFQAGDIDVFCIDGIDYEKYSGRSDLNIKKFIGNRFEFLSFNLKNPILSDPKVRRAFSFAVDRNKLLSEIPGSRGVVADIPVIPGTWLNDYPNGAFEYDPDKARKLLQEDGWKQTGGSFYKRINGVLKPLKLEMLVNDDNPLRLEAAGLLREQVGIAGIDLRIVPIAWEDEMKKLLEGKFDMAFMGCTVPSVPDLSQLYSNDYLLPYTPASAQGVRNVSGYLNREVENYIGMIFSETDPDRRKAYFLNMKQTLDADLPYIGLYFYNNAVLFTRRLRGELNPYVWDRFSGIEKWYLPEG